MVKVLTVFGVIAFLVVLLIPAIDNARKQPGVMGVSYICIYSARTGDILVSSTIQGSLSQTSGYLSWIDVEGAKHKQWLSDEIIVHISSQPLVKVE